MKKIFLSVILFVGVQLSGALACAQIIPELKKFFISDEKAKQYFQFFDSQKVTRIRSDSGAKELNLTDINCALTQSKSETDELYRHVGCSWFDRLTQKDITVYNGPVEALYQAMAKDFVLDCDGHDTCLSSAEKINCTYQNEKYSCQVEFWFFVPTPEAAPDETVPGAIPNPADDDPVPHDPDGPIADDPNPVTPIPVTPDPVAPSPVTPNPVVPTPLAPTGDQTYFKPVIGFDASKYIKPVKDYKPKMKNIEKSR